MHSLETVLEVIAAAADYWADMPQGESRPATIARVLKAVEDADNFLQAA